MKKQPLSTLFLCLTIMMPFLTTPSAANTQAYTLEQVVVLSRHGLRAPLATGDSELAKVTSKTWPSWHTQGSYLTTRGGVLESYFGQYFAHWLDETNLVKKTHCPTEQTIFIYTNSLQRTIATGQFFAIGAYPGCDITIHHKNQFNQMDPVFNPIITDGSPAFKQQALAAIAAYARENGIDDLNKPLMSSYQLAANIVDYPNSPFCKTNPHCSLFDTPNVFSIENHQEPSVTGPLRTGTIIADALILQHYEGFPAHQVGWGKVKSKADWQALIDIKNGYTDVLFSPPIIAKQIAKPLIHYMDTLWQDQNSAKFSLLVGHDSNIASVLSALNIKAYTLPLQFEKTPIGGKVVFQRWKNPKNNDQLMKIEYIYQSTAQIRNMQKLDANNPPQRVILEMQDCPIDKQGFCSFSQFKQVLNQLKEK